MGNRELPGAINRLFLPRCLPSSAPFPWEGNVPGLSGNWASTECLDKPCSSLNCKCHLCRPAKPQPRVLKAAVPLVAPADKGNTLAGLKIINSSLLNYFFFFKDFVHFAPKPPPPCAFKPSLGEAPAAPASLRSQTGSCTSLGEITEPGAR